MRQNLFVPAAICLFIPIIAGPAAASTGDDGSVTIDQPLIGLYARGEIITFSGTNTASGTTYLFFTGPGLDTDGAQIQSMHPEQSPVIDGDAFTFAAAGVGTDHRWSYTWDTQNVLIGSGTFTIYAASAPRDVAHINSTHSGRISFLKLPPENGGLPTDMIASTKSNEPIIITRPERQIISNSDILPSPSVVRQGNKITISGSVKGNPRPGIVVWIITWDPDPVHRGSGYSWTIVEPDSTGFYSDDVIDGPTTRRIEEGNYHVVVQHPMQNNIFDISLANGNETDMSPWVWNRMFKENNDANGSKIFMSGGPRGLNGENFYKALIEAFKDPSVDDTIAIAPPPAITPAGIETMETPRSQVVNNTEEKAIAQTRNDFSGAGPVAGPSFEVDTVMVDPAGDLASGTPVTVSYRVTISGKGTDETFPAGDELQMSTGLEKPRWASTLVLDGIENPQPGSNGRILIVSGWLLSYPSSVSEYLKVTLSGTTPQVTLPANVTLFTVTEYDSRGDRIAGSEIIRTARNNPGTGQPVLSGTGVQANQPVPAITWGTMTEKLRAVFSVANGTPASIFPAYRYDENVVNECTLVPFEDAHRPFADGFTYENPTVFNYGTAGYYASPVGMKAAGITTEQAKDLAKKAFPDYSPDRIDMDFSDGSYNIRGWEFDMNKDNEQLLVGWLDADTGEPIQYLIPSFMSENTQGKSNPAITMESARLTAEKEIRERNGEIPLKLIDSYVDIYGRSFFDYGRVINGVPCHHHGIYVGIDARTGKVGSYSGEWNIPEDAVAASSVPAISREQAIAVVERTAKPCYPESADSFRIVSADLQWMDTYDSNKFIPKPGVIPLGWHVRFDDTTIRGQEFRGTEDAWVDAQNGTLLSMEYFHNR